MTLRLGPASQRAVDTLAAQGMPGYLKPHIEMPYLPSDLTAVGDEDLMGLYSLLTAWCDYVGAQVSAAQVDERAAEKRLAHSENLLLSASGDRGDRVTFAKAQIAVDPEIVALRQDIEEQHAYRKMVESLAANLERDSSLVSRELTRRTATRSRTSPSRWSA